MAYLTERQRDVLGFIRRHIAARGLAPTLQEIADRFSFASTASAQKHVGLLEKKGYLRREKHQKRGLVLADPSFDVPDVGRRLPLLGTVAAGSPIESIADPELFDVPADLVQGDDHYLLRVRGDSMIDDGIHDDDIVIVNGKAAAREGEMVIALIGDEVTLKRLARCDGDTVRLQPANVTQQPIDVPADQLTIQGVVVGLVRRY